MTAADPATAWRKERDGYGRKPRLERVYRHYTPRYVIGIDPDNVAEADWSRMLRRAQAIWDVRPHATQGRPS